MILEPGEIALIKEIAAHRRRANTPPDERADNHGQLRAEMDSARQRAQQKLEELFAVAMAAVESPVILPEGVTFLGAHPSPKGTLLWFNTRVAEERETTFCLPLTEAVATQNRELLQPFTA